MKFEHYLIEKEVEELKKEIGLEKAAEIYKNIVVIALNLKNLKNWLLGNEYEI